MIVAAGMIGVCRAGCLDNNRLGGTCSRFLMKMVRVMRALLIHSLILQEVAAPDGQVEVFHQVLYLAVRPARQTDRWRFGKSRRDSERKIMVLGNVSRARDVGDRRLKGLS